MYIPHLWLDQNYSGILYCYMFQQSSPIWVNVWYYYSQLSVEECQWVNATNSKSRNKVLLQNRGNSLLQIQRHLSLFPKMEILREGKIVAHKIIIWGSK